MTNKDIEDLKSVLLELIDDVNGLLFYGIDPMVQIVETVSARFDVTKPQAETAIKSLVKVVDGYLEIKK